MRHVPSAAWGVLRQAAVGGKRTGNGKEDPNSVRGRRGFRRLSHLRWFLARPRWAGRTHRTNRKQRKRVRGERIGAVPRGGGSRSGGSRRLGSLGRPGNETRERASSGNRGVGRRLHGGRRRPKPTHAMGGVRGERTGDDR